MIRYRFEKDKYWCGFELNFGLPSGVWALSWLLLAYFTGNPAWMLPAVFSRMVGGKLGGK